MLKALNYILRFFGIALYALPSISNELMVSAREIVNQVGAMEGSGEYKRSQALRALLNSNPGVSERECALAIELVVNGG